MKKLLLLTVISFILVGFNAEGRTNILNPYQKDKCQNGTMPNEIRCEKNLDDTSWEEEGYRPGVLPLSMF